MDKIGAFLTAAGWGMAHRAPLAGDASARRYERLSRGTDRAVLMISQPGDEIQRFLRLARWFHDHGLSAPQILADGAAQGLLLLEDLGDALVSRLIVQNPPREAALYTGITTFLLHLHQLPPPDFVALLDGPGLADLLRLVPEWYPCTSRTAAEDLTGEIATLYAHLNTEPAVLSLRDFHAENVLWLPERSGPARLGLLDFQDAVATHPAYDLVSALQDVRRAVPVTIESRQCGAYASARGIDPDRFGTIYALLGVQRALRILGVFARLCRAMGKPHYVTLMPRCWANIERNLAHPALQDLARTTRAAFPAPTPELMQRIQDQCGKDPMR